MSVTCRQIDRPRYGNMCRNGRNRSQRRQLIIGSTRDCVRLSTLPNLAVHSLAEQLLHDDRAPVNLPAIARAVRHVIHDWFQSLTHRHQSAAQTVCRLCRHTHNQPFTVRSNLHVSHSSYNVVHVQRGGLGVHRGAGGCEVQTLTEDKNFFRTNTVALYYTNY